MACALLLQSKQKRDRGREYHELGHAFDHDSQGFASTNTETGKSQTATSGFQGIQQGGHHPCAGGSDWMAKRHRASVYIDFRRVQVEFPVNGKRHRAKGFIDFKEINLLDGQTCLLQNFLDGVNRGDGKPLGC